MKKSALICLALVSLAFSASFLFNAPSPKFFYCYDQGRIFVYSVPIPPATNRFYSEEAELKEGGPPVWNSLRGCIQLSFGIPQSENPLKWKPPREIVLKALEQWEAGRDILPKDYRRETYVTNFVSVAERYQH